ncbi:MAG: T9SS type A sorting domain-containing protein [Bacteroidota bacterium]|nr:T9SS type A sorting domain-containing protein [Bacteroidota bacterium]
MLLGGLDPYDAPFLYRTDDLGLRWERINSILLSQPPLEIIFDPAVPNRILVADPTGVYISTDDGVTWVYCDPGLGTRKTTCIALNPDNPMDIFLGVASPSRTEAIPQSREDGGRVWRSTDGGDTWHKLPIDGLYNYNISQLLVFRNPLRMFVGTPCGAYEHILDSTSSITPRTPEKAVGVQVQTYPNPCRQSVTISYTLHERSDIWITVYDILGRVVSSNRESTVLPGVHRFEMNTSGLRSGMYTVTLQTRSGVSASTILVARP